MSIATVGDKVLDVTAMRNGWPDQEGEIIELDGSNIKVRYNSGNERWKAAWNLRLIREDYEEIENE